VNALVIGSGVNELVAAHYLARAGHRVLVLEGGAAASHDESADIGWIPPRLARDLGLESHGLKIHYADPWAIAPLAAGGRLELWRDIARSVEAIRVVSAADAAKWPAFCERMARLGRLLERIYMQPPPDLMGGGAGNIVKLARLGLQVRRLRRGGMEDLLRLVPMSVADLLDEWFESDALKGILGAAGVMHASRGPRSGGTALRLLHHHIGSPPGIFRQSCSNVRRVLRGLRGIDTRSNASVDRLNVEEGGIVGVTLAGGEEIAASLVVSGADPQRTLLDFLDTRWLDPELVRDVRNIRCRGVTVRVRLALDRVPSFSTLVVAPTLDYLEHAYDDAKYGRLSRAPYLEARAMAPGRAAQAHIEVDMQYAPYRLAEGEWNEDRRVALGELTLKALATHAPELKAAAITRVLTPRDLELEYGFPEGQPEHAEPGLDQSLFMRPLPELAHYRTPIKGLYLCGPATHPGGSIAGAAGHNAAREMMRDAKAR
jgi:phytoene dehydrogenase-like protein